jgi:hypothetical protein
MIVKQYEAIVERRRHVQTSLLPVFDEIAQTCIKLARGGQGGINPLQSYLDGRISIDGATCSRRSVLLAIHDMAQDSEAPLALQRKALAQLMMLQMLPIPKLSLYRDIATAILRMEVVIRSAAAQAPKEQKPEPILSPATAAHWEDVREWVRSSVDALSVGLAGVRAAMPVLHAPRLSALALSGLRYQMRYYRPASLRAAVST